MNARVKFLKQLIDFYRKKIDEKCLYDGMGLHVVKCDWTADQVHAFARDLWNLGITDGINNDADHADHEDVDDINGDLEEVSEDLDQGCFNGSFMALPC